jgi:hypothetical protein
VLTLSSRQLESNPGAALETTEQQPSDALKKRSRFKRLGGWLKDKLATLKPGPRAWKGAVIGAILAGAGLLALLGATSHTGLGILADSLIGLSIGLVGIALFWLLIVAITSIARTIPKSVVGAVLGAVLAIVILPALLGEGRGPLLVLVALLVPLEALFGASAGAVFGGELAGANWLKRIITGTCLLLAVSANAFLIFWLSNGGSTIHLVQPDAADGKHYEIISAPDPSQPGSFEVRKLFYGSGTDKRRPEFGTSVDIKTEPVDASLLLPELKGFKARMRKWYWGFDATQFPVNGRVWFPNGTGPFALVLIVHGNHEMEQYSDAGYAYLGELLASRGFITVSVDENFLNGSWSGDLQGKELPARGWMLLQHLRMWREWSEQQDSPFYQKVDLQNIALIGHSRGGEAVAVAAAFNKLSHYPEDANVKFDFKFPIKSLIAIAPSDEFYKPAGNPMTLENLNYFVLQGGHDGDVATFLGSRQYQRVKFGGDDYHFKSALWIYRANHGQFNTTWGDTDWDEPLGRMVNVKALIDASDQRRIAKAYVSGFLEATLHGERAYVPMFRDHRAASGWLPETIYLNRFRDSRFKVVSDYEEDTDVATTTIPGGSEEGENLKVWKEEKLPLRVKGDSNQENNVVRLGWEQAEDKSQAFYRITLPETVLQQWRLDPETRLSFALANASEMQDPIDLAIELASSDGARASVPLKQIAPINPPLTIQFSKMKWLESMLLKRTGSSNVRVAARGIRQGRLQIGYRQAENDNSDNRPDPRRNNRAG